MAGARFLFFSRGVNGVSWRLVAPNNREIARTPFPAADVDAVSRQVEILRGSAESAPARLVREAATDDVLAGWRWQLEVAASPVAVGSRLYARRLECEFALNQFRMIAPGAEAVLVVRALIG